MFVCHWSISTLRTDIPIVSLIIGERNLRRTKIKNKILISEGLTNSFYKESGNRRIKGKYQNMKIIFYALIPFIRRIPLLLIFHYIFSSARGLWTPFLGESNIPLYSKYETQRYLTDLTKRLLKTFLIYWPKRLVRSVHFAVANPLSVTVHLIGLHQTLQLGATRNLKCPNSSSARVCEHA